MSNEHLIIFRTDDGAVSLDVRMDEDTVWLTLDQMAALFDRDKSTVSRHIKNVFEEGELEQSATVAKFATVQQEGARQVERQIDYYNLDVIISVGYRVKSLRGTQRRITKDADLPNGRSALYGRLPCVKGAGSAKR